MTNTGSGGAGELSSGDVLTAADLSGEMVSVGQLQALTSDLAGVSGPDEAIAEIDKWSTAWGDHISPTATALREDLAGQVKDAITRGIIKPDEVGAAFYYAEGQLGFGGFTAKAIKAGLVAAAIASFAVTVLHRQPKTTTPQPTYLAPLGGKMTSVLTGNTPGDRMVRAAEKALTPHRITTKGIPKDVTKAIEWATALTYSDLTQVIAGTATRLFLMDAHTRRLAEEALKRAPTTVAKTTQVAAKLPRWVFGLRTKVAHDEHLIGELQTAVRNLERHVTTTTTPPRTHTGTPIPIKVDHLESLVGDIQTFDRHVTAELHTMTARVAELTPLIGFMTPSGQLETKAIRDLQAAIKTLEDCCYENKQQTVPLKRAGGSAKLIHELRGLLVKAFAIGILATIVDTIFAILDQPDVIIGTIRGAEWTVPIALRAATVASHVQEWSDKMHLAG